MNLSTMSKAITAGIISAFVGVMARYGFRPDAQTISAVGVIVTAVVSYILGHVVVFFAPKNTEPPSMG